MNNPQDLLRTLVSELISDPQTVEINVTEARSTTVLSVWVPERDRGKVIGAGGCIFKALQTLFNALGRAAGKTLVIELDE